MECGDAREAIRSKIVCLCVGEWNTIRYVPCLYRDRETESYTYIQLYEVDMMMVQREIYPCYQHPPHCSHNVWSVDDETDDDGEVVERGGLLSSGCRW